MFRQTELNPGCFIIWSLLMLFCSEWHPHSVLVATIVHWPHSHWGKDKVSSIVHIEVSESLSESSLEASEELCLLVQSCN